MTRPRADISAPAQEMLEELQRAGTIAPDPADMPAYRARVRAGFAPWAEAAARTFDGAIEDIEIAGIACKQLTPAGWRLEDGCIQYAFGGGFVSGSPFEDLVIAAPLARASGARIVMVDYRLSPEHPYPLPQRDMQSVYPALLEVYGAARLAVAGESAGGNQALALLQQLRDSGLELPRGAALLSPWCDLANRGDSHDFNDGRDPSLSHPWADLAAELHAGGHALDDAGISPLYGDLRDLPPVIVTSGSRDLLLSQALRLAARLRAAGVDCDLRVWEGMWHVFEFYPIPEAAASIAEVGAFLRQRLSLSAAPRSRG